MTDLTASALAEALRDRYVLERELGRGGMATVYLAHDTKHDRKVALKVLHAQLGTMVGLERFHREIRLAARLQHPHILPVHDSGETAGHLWYTMPFVDGESLRDRLRRERQLPISDALQITREVADALGYAHSEGVVHRDIKPENILLSHGHALVADFGVARALTSAGTEGLTEAGVSVGTPAYMSPEQSLADPVIDGRSDLYSLGCVLYEMLAGEAPYTGTSAQAIVAKRLREPVPHVRTVRETVPPSVDQALERVLAKTAADRFATAEGFAGALTIAGTDSTGTTPTYVPDERRMATPARDRGRRPRFSGRLLAAVISAALILVGVLTWQHLHSGRQRTGPTKLAVLPFENRGDSADAYFAEGVTDAVRDKLSSVPGLEVIASSSSDQYRHTSKPVQQIGRELGVHYLLAGKVRWSKSTTDSRVQVRPELVDATTGAQRWGEPFDAALTDVFGVQADIATKVAQSLQVALAPPTQRVLTRTPTASLDAYDAYLRATDLEKAGAADVTADRVVDAYSEAVRRDSTFALAWAGLASAHLRRHRATHDSSEGAAALAAISRAQALAPDLPEAYARAGEYETFVRHDNPKALAAYENGLRHSPANALLLGRVGWAEMRLGRWDSAAAHLERARELDPRSQVRASDVVVVLWALRRYPQARTAVERALSLGPATIGIIHRLIGLDLSDGKLADARAHLANAPPTLARVSLYADQPAWLLDRAQLTTLAAASPQQFGDDDASRKFVLMNVHSRLGDSTATRSYADSAVRAYATAMARAPDDPELHVRLAIALSRSGRREEAIREAERADSLSMAIGDQLAAPMLGEQVAQVYLVVGEPERAVGRLESILKRPGAVTADYLRINPVFESLRGNPSLGVGPAR